LTIDKAAATLVEIGIRRRSALIETKSSFDGVSVTRVAGSPALSRDAFILFRGFPGEPPPAQLDKYRHLASRAAIASALHSATGLDVHVFSYPGLTGNPGPFSFMASVERSLAFALAGAPKDYDKVHVAGYSWGGLVGFNAWRALERRKGMLILISPLTDLGDDAAVRRFLPPYILDYPNIFGPDLEAALGPAAADLCAVRDRFNPMTLAAADGDGAAAALIVHGSEDREVAVDSSRRFKTLFPARYAELADDHIYTKYWDRMLAGIAEFASRGTTRILADRSAGGPER
jgi:pimeloyl-ACP methyl ester carboxylesterase